MADYFKALRIGLREGADPLGTIMQFNYSPGDLARRYSLVSVDQVRIPMAENNSSNEFNLLEKSIRNIGISIGLVANLVTCWMPPLNPQAHAIVETIANRGDDPIFEERLKFESKCARYGYPPKVMASILARKS
jgi:hypothetical protein